MVSLGFSLNWSNGSIHPNSPRTMMMAINWISLVVRSTHRISLLMRIVGGTRVRFFWIAHRIAIWFGPRNWFLWTTYMWWFGSIWWEDLATEFFIAMRIIIGPTDRFFWTAHRIAAWFMPKDQFFWTAWSMPKDQLFWTAYKWWW